MSTAQAHRPYLTAFCRGHVHVLVVVATAAHLAVGCAQIDDPSLDAFSPDGQFDPGLLGGKADGSDFSDCELEEVVDLVNRPGVDEHVLRELGVHTRAARNIVAFRAGPDGSLGTDDDRLVASAGELDAIDWVGPVAFQQLVDAVEGRCLFGAGTIDAVFSPDAWESSHLARALALIDGAQRSLDIAMYSLRDRTLIDALGRAVERGVSVRLIFHTASEDRREPEGTTSAQLEELGIDVRWVNPVMHHKFLIVDGPRDGLEQLEHAVLLTGSANWSNWAATKYDENTVVIRGNAELILAFQSEFNHMWDNSRDFVWGEARQAESAMAIEPAMIPRDAAVEILFTSANFGIRNSERYGPTFTVDSDSFVVSDRLVELIESARSTIDIASGHLRLRPVFDALVRARAANPDLQIRIYLDGQEYVSRTAHDRQVADVEACRREAETEDDFDECGNRGFRYGYAASLEGMDVRYQFYSYRWHWAYAVQMHHKYLLIDGRYLASGSYNLSENAEQGTLENLVIYDGAAYPELVADFRANFERMWRTGHDEGLYERLMATIETADEPGETVPLVFEPMAATWDQVTAIKAALQRACPAVFSDEYAGNPAGHRVCEL